MYRGIIILLVVILLGGAAIYTLERGGALFLKPPVEARIAYVADAGEGPDIWTMKTDGSDKIQVTNDEADDRLPVWSPNGKELASISDRIGDSYQMFVSAWNGSYTNGLTTSTGVKDNPMWSPDGSEITFISSGKVYMKRRHGGPEQQYLPPSSMPGASIGQMTDPYVFADWSPDGDALLFMQETDQGRAAFVIERDKAQLLEDQSLKPLGVTIARSLDVAWAPEGEVVAAAFMNREGENGLLVANLQTLIQKDLFVTKGDGRGAANPVWSPDGKRIAFEMWAVTDGLPDKCLGVYVIDVDGGEPVPFLEGDARQPTWSPDGRQLACTLARPDGGRDIWRVNADGTGAVSLTNGEGDNYSPAWSPAIKARYPGRP